MFKKIKNKIEKIKDAPDSEKDKLLKEIISRGIFNIDFFAREVGLVEPELRQLLNESIEEGQIRGYYTFKNTEFITFNYLKEQINKKMEGSFKIDLKKLALEFGVSLKNIFETINELCRQDLQHGFFDVPANAIFFHVEAQDQEKFVSILSKGKVHLSKLAEFIDELIESKEDIDFDSLIYEVTSNEESELNEWESLAKDAVDVTLGNKRARLWVENLLAWYKIRGNFSQDNQYFVPLESVTNEIANYINETGRVKTSELQKKLGIELIEILKSELEKLEENNLIKGFLTLDDTEYVSEKKVLEEIANFINEKDQDIFTIVEIHKNIGIDPTVTGKLVRILIAQNKVEGLISRDNKHFYSNRYLDKELMNILEKNERISFKTINEKFNLLTRDLVSHIENLIARKNLRVIVTLDKSDIIQDEKMIFTLMERLKKSKKSILSELSKTVNIKVTEIVRLIKYMLEFGLIKGKLTKKEFILE